MDWISGLIMLTLIAAVVVFPAVGIVSAIGFEDDVFERLGEDKNSWLYLQVFLGMFVTPIYFFWIRPKLKRIEAEDAADYTEWRERRVPKQPNLT